MRPALLEAATTTCPQMPSMAWRAAPTARAAPLPAWPVACWAAATRDSRDDPRKALVALSSARGAGRVGCTVTLWTVIDTGLGAAKARCLTRLDGRDHGP